jgi:hypothetical protein
LSLERSNEGEKYENGGGSDSMHALFSSLLFSSLGS